MFSKGNSGGHQQPDVTHRERPSTAPSSAASSSPSSGMSMPSIVSGNLKITGDMLCDGDIQIEGTVEGNITSRLLTVGESGSVKGEIVADQVTIAGTVVGKVKARTVTLSQTSDVSGDITHEALGIEAGARFEGSCKKIDMSKKGSSPAEEALRKAAESVSQAGTSGGGPGASASVTAAQRL